MSTQETKMVDNKATVQLCTNENPDRSDGSLFHD
jgi:hypothetical protein